jgi:hypothetical protein
MEEAKPVAPVEMPKPKRAGGFKKFVRWFTLLLILGLGLFVFWKYFYTYSNGVQGGKMQKISKRGNIFKTWEGYLLISLNTDNNNSLSLTTKDWPFSVASDSIANLLEKYEGRRVTVRYNQKNGTLPWRGDSEYIIYEVSVEP